MLPSCALLPKKHGGIEDWRATNKAVWVGKAQVIRETDDVVFFKAYCATSPTSCLYKWLTYEVCRSDLSAHDKERIRGISGND